MAGQGTTEERLERLERAVAELQRVVLVGALLEDEEAEGPTPGVASPPPVSPAARSATRRAQEGPVLGIPAGLVWQERAEARGTEPPPPPRDWLALAHLWVGRVGIALLVLGLAFLYRYAVGRGWLTPELRIGFGAVVGAALLAAGMRLQAARSNRAYGLLLLGGAVGVLYLTAYAAFGFYRLVPAGAALLALAVLTLFTVRLAAGRAESVLAQLGAVGAFLAPILVRSDHPSLPLFAGYVVLVVGWTGWTALREGWRLLSWTSMAGGAVLLVLAQSSAVTGLERGLLVAAALLAVPGGAAALLWRARAGESASPAWKRSRSGVAGYTAEQSTLASTSTLAVLASVYFAIYTGSTYHWPLPLMGIVALVEAVLLGACAWAWRDDVAQARAIALAAAVPLLLGTLALQLQGARGALALEALALLLIGKRAGARALAALGHAVFAGVLLVYFGIVMQSDGHAQAAWVLATDAAAIAAALYATTFLPALVAVRIYATASLLASLAWLHLALLPLPGGQYWVSIAWGLVGSSLLVAGKVRADTRLRVGALLALAAVALKLLFVDTATLPAGGRVVVFLGFGVLFLVLGALYRKGTFSSRASPPAASA